MKKHEVRRLEGIVEVLCHDLKGDPYALHRLAELILGCIDLTRNGKAWKATSIALETSARLASSLEQARAASRDAQRQDGPTAWSVPVSIRTTHPSFTGYVGINHDAPRPAATVEQMRAAADAAMAADPELVEWECDTCHKKTLTDPDADQVLPIGWSTSTNLNTGEAVYTCNECRKFGPKRDDDHIGWFVCNGCGQRTATADGKKPLAWVFNVEVDGEVYKALCPPCFGTGIKKQYQCMGCDAETESRVFPPPGWKEVEDGEVICFACAEEEAKP